MAPPARPKTSTPISARKSTGHGTDSGRFRMFQAAGLLAGLVALVLATGLGAAGTSLAMNLSPLPVINTAAFVFLAAATVVSGSIVFSFWQHLLAGLAPAETRPANIKRQRPARPLRDI